MKLRGGYIMVAVAVVYATPGGGGGWYILDSTGVGEREDGVLQLGLEKTGI